MKPKRILIVDDEKTVCDLLKETLAAAYPNFEISIAENGTEAFEQAHQRPFDLIFTDYSMPGLNGLELARSVRDISPNTHVVLMSGTNKVTIQNDPYYTIDLDGFIFKPFGITQILDITKQCFVGEPSRLDISILSH